VQEKQENIKPKSTPRGALANASWNGFATLFSIAITFLMAPLLISRLGTDQWGLLLLIWSVTGLLGVANFGVGEAALRFVAHYLAENDRVGVHRVLRATLTFYVSICTVISLVMFVATRWVGDWVKVPQGTNYPVEWLLRLSALLFSFGMIANAFRSIPMALQRYDISSRIGVVQSVVRSGGIIGLVLSGFGILSVILWETFVAAAALVAQAVVARRLLPGIPLLPSLSGHGFREIFGYSIFSFLTHIFLMIYREIGKLVLGTRVGTASVAYLGTPDSIAYRLHMIVISGIETLMPRFSASRDQAESRNLLVMATWAGVSCGVVLYIPLAVLMPDFLRLWINPEFAHEGGLVGQILALSFIAPAAYAPIATLFRGTGKPEFVTITMAAAGIAVLIATLMLVTSHGALGVAYGYAFSAIAWLGGLVAGWFWLYGKSSSAQLGRILLLPLILGCLLAVLESTIRAWWGPVGWVGLIIFGGTFAGLNAAIIVLADRLVGGNSPADDFISKLSQSRKVIALRRRFAAV
jgi:O-antigen/teichoic acid export membrane protein